MNHQQEAERLTSQGYRKTSNKYRMVSRIDREDWLEVLAEKMRRAPADFIVRDGTGQVSGSWCDHYRRVYSKDTITYLDPEVFRLIPSSSFDKTGYLPKEAS